MQINLYLDLRKDMTSLINNSHSNSAIEFFTRDSSNHHILAGGIRTRGSRVYKPTKTWELIYGKDKVKEDKKNHRDKQKSVISNKIKGMKNSTWRVGKQAITKHVRRTV